MIAAFALLLAVALPADFAERVDALVRAELARQHVAGIAVGVAYHGQVVVARGYGVRDRAGNLPVDAHTQFALGSITKTFTATLVMQLVAGHRLGLDDRLDRYVPDAPHAREMTIRELLAQRTGLADYLDGQGFRDRATRADVGVDELLAPIAAEPLGFMPGAHYAYSNTNYLLLGMVIERVTGMPYERAIQRMLAQAHLVRTTYGPDLGSDDAIGYSADQREVRWSAAALRAAGALWSDAGDVLAFDQAFFDGRLVARPTAGAMTTSADTETSPFAYGLGWMVSERRGHREVWHNGALPGFKARNSVFPDDRLAIVVLSNGVLFDEEPVVGGILALLDPAVATRAPAPPRVPLDDPGIAALAIDVFRELQRGSIDRTRFSAAGNRAFPDEVVTALGTEFAELGTPVASTLRDRHYVGNLQSFDYRLHFAAFDVDEVLTLDRDGKISSADFWPVLSVAAGGAPAINARTTTCTILAGVASAAAPEGSAFCSASPWTSALTVAASASGVTGSCFPACENSCESTSPSACR